MYIKYLTMVDANLFAGFGILDKEYLDRIRYSNLNAFDHFWSVPLSFAGSFVNINIEELLV